MPAYVTSVDIRKRLDKIESGASVDALLDEFGAEATDLINAELGFEFGEYPALASAKAVYGDGSPYLRLPAHLAGSVVSVTAEDGTAISSDLWVEDPDGWLYLKQTHASWMGPGWSERGHPGLAQSQDSEYGPIFSRGGWGRARYMVSARWGYGPVPPRVKGVCTELAVNMWREKDRGMYSDVIGVEASGEVRVGYARALTNRQKMVLESVKAKYQRKPSISSIIVR